MIFIKGTGFSNKGAELMLYCIARRLHDKYGDRIPVCASRKIGDDYGRSVMRDLGILKLAELRYHGVDIGNLSNCLPGKIGKTLGIVAPRECTHVLDASGLSYTDKFGNGSLMRMGAFYISIKARKGKVVLLPQAFGPLTVTRFQNAFRDMLRFVDLVYARDSISLEVVKHYAPDTLTIRLSPDLTIGESFDCEPIPQAEGAVGLIPNYRLMESWTRREPVNLVFPLGIFAMPLLVKEPRSFFYYMRVPEISGFVMRFNNMRIASCPFLVILTRVFLSGRLGLSMRQSLSGTTDVSALYRKVSLALLSVGTINIRSCLLISTRATHT